MEHLQNHFESDFEKGDVLVDFLAFDEPVGVFVPDSGIEGFDGFGEAVVCEIVFDFFFAGGEFAANPVFTHVVGRVIGGGVGVLINEGLNKSSDVPELVTEVAAGDDGVLGEGLVHAGGAAAENAEAEGVGAILRDKFNGVDDVTFGFGHFLTVCVKH